MSALGQTEAWNDFRADDEPFGPFLRVVLTPAGTGRIHLKLPVRLPKENAEPVAPMKWLRNAAVSVMGMDGQLKTSRDAEGAVPDDEEPVEGAVYYFVAVSAAPHPLEFAVDMEMARARSHLSGSDASSRPRREERLKNELVSRHIHCCLTDVPSNICNPVHIIPFHKGDEWLQLLVESRPRSYDPNLEDLTELDTINDIRNAFFASPNVHAYLGNLQLVIIKTPNGILSTTDIPRDNRILTPDVEFPSDVRFTAQWIKGTNADRAVVPNNSDMSFAKGNGGQLSNPSPLLLEYMFGVALVKHWGYGQDFLGPEHRTNVRRPVSAPLDPTLKRKMREQKAAARGGRTAEGMSQLEAEELVYRLWCASAEGVERRKAAIAEEEAHENFRLDRLMQWRERTLHNNASEDRQSR
ncbi:hypothetical protein HMN09_00491100 [Mycena chlorophos]|uniref:HNH nuclease domain-containing protein n=1 Tax=Mycena chlorophos TaxID=658473 RepID=A0A8H6T9Q5_MYCCL|nr:hypothetical protein HMN09_00491100 [Mycena chlorophos]